MIIYTDCEVYHDAGKKYDALALFRHIYFDGDEISIGISVILEIESTDVLFNIMLSYKECANVS